MTQFRRLFLWTIPLFFLLGSAHAEVKSLPIASCDDLKRIKWDMDAYYYLVTDLDCSAEEANPFHPIEGVFYGTLDGNGYAISHLIIENEKGQRSEPTGLFRVLGENSKITNIYFHEVTLIGHDDAHKGLIAGIAAGPVEVSDVYVEGLQMLRYEVGIPPFPDNSHDYGVTGGLLGLTSGDIVLHDVHLSEEVFILQNAFAGGLIGAIEGNATISLASVTQLSIQGGKTCDNPKNECGFGGLIGLIGEFKPKRKTNNAQYATRQGYNVQIVESYAKGSGVSQKNMGGLVGLIKLDRSLQIQNSYATVDITCGSTGTAFDSCKYAGGLIGQAKQGTDQKPISLENVYAAGLNDLSGDDKGRGIIGHNQQNGSTRVVNAPLTQSFFDSDTTEKQHSGDKVSKGLSSVDMQVAAPIKPDRPFYGWDKNIWFFKNGYYPSLINTGIK